MIVAGLDLETTGIDTSADRPIEVGLCLWSTNYNRSLESHSFLVQSGLSAPVSEEVTEITGITQGMLNKFDYSVTEGGTSIEDGYDEVMRFVDRAEAIVTFNGPHFDIPMMHNWAKRLGRTFPDDKLIIDPYFDMPLKQDKVSPGMRPQELITMCAKEGIYFDAHGAGEDIIATLKLMSKRKLELVIERAKSPVVAVRAMQRRNENHLAKKFKFRWNPDYKVWWKAVKEIDIEYLHGQINGAFPICEADQTIEMLEASD